MPQTMKVEYMELMDRAKEVEAPLPDPPNSVPEPPCGLAFLRQPVRDLVNTAASLREYLGYGAKERLRLATSLRNAAKAYETVDEDARHAIEGGNGSVSGVTLEDTNGAPDATMLGDGPTLMAAATPDDYRDLKGRCHDIEGGDQGASLAAFGDAWAQYGQTLRDPGTIARFRRFNSWEGEATTAVERNFEDHKTWMRRMAELCEKVGTEANTLVSAHRAAEAKHIIYSESLKCLVPWSRKMNKEADIEYIEQQYYYGEKVWRPNYMAVLARLQEISDEVIAEYKGKIDVRPDVGISPPTASHIDPPPAPIPTPKPGPWDFLDDFQAPETPSLPQVPNMNKPEMPTDMPLMDAALTDDLAASKGGPSTGGMKPASFGGGMPLQPAIDPDAAARAAAASRDAAGLGRGLAGAGAGGMGGGMPMGGAPGGKGKDGGQAKRMQGDEESLYTEDRAWTEGVIGRRRPPKETPENKDFK